jgi:hypothetical protein
MTFRILAGLPAEGPPPEQFTYEGKRTHSEGTVVEFTAASSAWVANFQPAIGTFSGAVRHPDGHHVVVVAGGKGYVVDPITRRLEDAPFGGSINGLWAACEGELLIFNDSGIRFSALDRTGWRWHTRRISWDGFDSLALTPHQLSGRAWNAIDQRWLEFSIDLAEGTVHGGAYVEFGDRAI